MVCSIAGTARNIKREGDKAARAEATLIWRPTRVKVGWVPIYCGKTAAAILDMKDTVTYDPRAGAMSATVGL
jgi:hypothetical protein